MIHNGSIRNLAANYKEDLHMNYVDEAVRMFDKGYS